MDQHQQATDEIEIRESLVYQASRAQVWSWKASLPSFLAAHSKQLLSVATSVLSASQFMAALDDRYCCSPRHLASMMMVLALDAFSWDHLVIVGPSEKRKNGFSESSYYGSLFLDTLQVSFAYSHRWRSILTLKFTRATLGLDCESSNSAINSNWKLHQ